MSWYWGDAGITSLEVGIFIYEHNKMCTRHRGVGNVCLRRGGVTVVVAQCMSVIVGVGGTILCAYVV